MFQKTGKMTPIVVKKLNFWKSSISYGTSGNPNLLVLYNDKNFKNANKKCKNENFEKQNNALLSHVPRIIQPRNWVHM